MHSREGIRVVARCTSLGVHCRRATPCEVATEAKGLLSAEPGREWWAKGGPRHSYGITSYIDPLRGDSHGVNSLLGACCITLLQVNTLRNRNVRRIARVADLFVILDIRVVVKIRIREKVGNARDSRLRIVCISEEK